MLHLRKKSTILAILLAVNLGTSFPKPAEASVYLFTNARNDCVYHPFLNPLCGVINDIFGTLAGFAAGIAGGVTIANFSVWGAAITAALVVLDEHGEIPHDSLTSAFLNRYPSIDRGSALNLASLIEEKSFHSTRNENGFQEISLSRQEVSRALESSGIEELDEEKFNQIVFEFQ